MSDGKQQFWKIAEPWLAKPGVTKSTMMGFPCLRLEGKYFASVHKDGTAMIIKLPEGRVLDLVAEGAGENFAPAGRVFREWLAVPSDKSDTWADYLEEAHAFAGA